MRVSSVAVLSVLASADAFVISLPGGRHEVMGPFGGTPGPVIPSHEKEGAPPALEDSTILGKRDVEEARAVPKMEKPSAFQVAQRFIWKGGEKVRADKRSSTAEPVESHKFHLPAALRLTESTKREDKKKLELPPGFKVDPNLKGEKLSLPGLVFIADNDGLDKRTDAKEALKELKPAPGSQGKVKPGNEFNLILPAALWAADDGDLTKRDEKNRLVLPPGTKISPGIHGEKMHLPGALHIADTDGLTKRDNEHKLVLPPGTKISPGIHGEKMHLPGALHIADTDDLTKRGKGPKSGMRQPAAQHLAKTHGLTKRKETKEGKNEPKLVLPAGFKPENDFTGKKLHLPAAVALTEGTDIKREAQPITDEMKKFEGVKLVDPEIKTKVKPEFWEIPGVMRKVDSIPE